MFNSKIKSKNVDESHANLKYRYGQKTFWARGYYVSTFGLNKNTIKLK